MERRPESLGRRFAFPGTLQHKGKPCASGWLMLYSDGMEATDPTTRRLSLRINKDLKHEVATEAEKRGQSLTVFVERALRAALTRTVAEHPAPTNHDRLNAS